MNRGDILIFSSISFLFYFLPIVLILYFAVPFKLKNLVLLLSSLFFYFYGEPIYGFLMIGTILSAYIHGLLIGKFKGKAVGKFFLCTSVIIPLVSLCFFKYADFFISNINIIFGGNFDLLKLALPIGISFYTFQALSYNIDVYRNEVAVQKNLLNLATYIALFPQLIAGPIVRYADIEAELRERTHSFENFSYGANRFIIGLAKKVLIADSLGTLSMLLHDGDASVVGYWVYGVAVSLQLYFDFSGYSDMAIGLGRIFGFHFLENFNYPFVSKSIGEFWRRWHISLGRWFRDYLYIPLGGNRVKIPRFIFNTALVWLCTGFWHGADWTFILWGLYFAIFLVIEKFFLNKVLKRLPAFLTHFYVCLVVMLSFVLFSSNGLENAVNDFKCLFGAGDLPLFTSETGYYLLSYSVILVMALVGSTPLIKSVVLSLKRREKLNKIINVLEPIIQLSLLAVITAYMVDGSFSPFLYFRF